MPITYLPETREFHLHNGLISYALRVHDNGTLGHLHFGAPLAAGRAHAYLVTPAFTGFANRVGDPVPLEYPTTGSGDYRIPAMTVELADGSTVLDLVYRDHRIVAGKPGRAPDDRLPATYVETDAEADTLEIALVDAPSGLAVDLTYTIFADRPVITRSAVIRNEGSGTVRLTGAMSATLDLPDDRWERIQLSGAWARENHVITSPLRPGRQSVGSDRGASSANHNPFIALRRPTTTESRGRGLRHEPRLLGQLHRRGRGRSVEHDPSPDRDQPEHVHLDARAGRQRSRPPRPSSSTPTPGSVR